MTRYAEGDAQMVMQSSLSNIMQNMAPHPSGNPGTGSSRLGGPDDPVLRGVAQSTRQRAGLQASEWEELEALLAKLESMEVGLLMQIGG